MTSLGGFRVKYEMGNGSNRAKWGVLRWNYSHTNYCPLASSRKKLTRVGSQSVVPFRVYSEISQ